MARQRCLLTDMVDDTDPVHVRAGLPGMLETIKTHLTTDFTSTSSRT